MRPNASTAAAAAPSSVTSKVVTPTSPPLPRQRSAAAASCAAASGWSARITSLPVAASRAATAAPMSPAAPVTRTARHTVTVARRTSACRTGARRRGARSGRCRRPQPANGAAALATSRCSSPSWSITRWTKTSEPRSSITRMRAGIGTAADDDRLGAKADRSARSPPRSSAMPTSLPPICDRPGRRDVQLVHGGRADEARDEQIGRRVVERRRRVALLQVAVAQHRDPVAHRHRLDLVVRDVDGRHGQALLQLDELGAGLDAQLRVEVRERLVHQVDLRVPDDRPAHRDALTLAAREVARLAVEVGLEIEQLGRLANALLCAPPWGRPAA